MYMYVGRCTIFEFAKLKFFSEQHFMSLLSHFGRQMSMAGKCVCSFVYYQAYERVILKMNETISVPV